MKITICGSIAFYEEMLDIKGKLERIGYQIKLPPSEIEDDNGKMITVKEYYSKRKSETSNIGCIWDKKEEAMREHFRKVERSDAVLILNYDKNNISNYIGVNTLLELGLAFHLNKRLFLWNDILEIDSKEEILGMKPTVINKDLTEIK